jgi:hypothetical protein
MPETISTRPESYLLKPSSTALRLTIRQRTRVLKQWRYRVRQRMTGGAKATARKLKPLREEINDTVYLERRISTNSAVNVAAMA